MTDEPKPCPRCGGRAEIDGVTKWWVCAGCEASSPDLAAWNSRPAIPAEAVEAGARSGYAAAFPADWDVKWDDLDETAQRIWRGHARGVLEGVWGRPEFAPTPPPATPDPNSPPRPRGSAAAG